jgi:hypothetical protein
VTIFRAKNKNKHLSELKNNNNCIFNLIHDDNAKIKPNNAEFNFDFAKIDFIMALLTLTMANPMFIPLNLTLNLPLSGLLSALRYFFSPNLNIIGSVK